MLIAIALVAFALIAQAIEEGWIGPQVGLGGFVVAAILLAAGMFETRRFPGPDNAAPDDGVAAPEEADATAGAGSAAPADTVPGSPTPPPAPKPLALPPRRAARMRETDP